MAVTLTGTHDIARLFQLPDSRPDRVDLLPVDKGQAFQRKIPILRQGQHLRQQALGFQGQVLVPQVVVGHHRVAPVFLHSKNCHLVVHSFHLKFHRAVKGGELARLVGTFLIHTKLVLPVRAVETAGAAVLRRSGLAVVKMICARPRLHELFKGPVAAGSKVHRRSPPFWFWAQKSGVLISPKGKRERRCLRCRIQFSMCHYLGGGLHGRKKRVKAQSESSKSVVNSVLISREMPVFPGFLEIIRVVIITISKRTHEKTLVFSCVLLNLGYSEAFRPVQSNSQTSEWYSIQVGIILTGLLSSIQRSRSTFLLPFCL